MSHRATSLTPSILSKRFEEDFAFLAISDEGDIDGVQRRLLDGGLLFAGIGLAGFQQHAGARHRSRADEVTTIQFDLPFLEDRKSVVLGEQKRGSDQADVNAKIRDTIV